MIISAMYLFDMEAIGALNHPGSVKTNKGDVRVNVFLSWKILLTLILFYIPTGNA